MLLNDEISFKTNVINKFVSVYNKDKNLGCIFPRIINSDNTLLASGLRITLLVNDKNETQVKYHLNGMHSYYNYTEGLIREPLGNLGFCFMTTYKNLIKHGWFRLDFDELFYESEFATKCSLSGLNTYIDNDSVIQLPNIYLREPENLDGLNKDFNTLVNCLKEIPKSVNYMKKIMVPSNTLQKRKEPND